jgi:hypothetical protein
MAYNMVLADRVRKFLAGIDQLHVEEKKMFRGLSFMINGKMCVSVSHENLMCRFDPARQEEIANRKGFQPMIMKGRVYTGYCYVSGDGYQSKKDFEYWLTLCLDVNKRAKASKKK